MKKIIKGIKTGRDFVVDFFCAIEDGKTTYFLQDGRTYSLHENVKVYYRQERTWDDHMGNTPCGYYVIVPLPGGERRRVYMF